MLTPNEVINAIDRSGEIGYKPQLPRQSEGSVTYICSVCPWPLYSRQNHITTGIDGGSGKWGITAYVKKYRLGAGSTENPQVLPVYDTAQLVMSQMNPSGPRVPAPITSYEVAASLLQLWGTTLGVDSGFSIGIGVIASPKPTPDEIRKLNERQVKFFEYLIRQGDEFYLRREFHKLSDLHITACRFMGQEKVWSEELKFTEKKDCIACGEEIRSNALKCKECGEYLPEFVERAKIKLSVVKNLDPYLFARMGEMKASAQSSKE